MDYYIGDLSCDSLYYLKDKFVFNNFLNDISDSILYRGYIDKDYLLYQLNEISKNDLTLIIIISPLNNKLFIEKDKDRCICPDIYYNIKQNKLENDNPFLLKEWFNICNNAVETTATIKHLKIIENNLRNKYNIKNIYFLNNGETGLPLDNFELKKVKENNLWQSNLLSPNNTFNSFGLLYYNHSKINLNNNYLLLSTKSEFVLQKHSYKSSYIVLYKGLNDLVGYQGTNITMFELDDYKIQTTKNILIITHAIIGQDGITLEMKETINELYNYHDEVNITVINIGINGDDKKDDDKKDDYELITEFSLITSEGHVFNVYNINLNNITMSNHFYLKVYHDILIDLIKTINPCLLILSMQLTCLHHHIISLFKYYKIPVVIRWSGSEVKNDIHLLVDSINNSDYVIKIGDKLVDNKQISNENKIIKHFACSIRKERIVNNIKEKYKLDDNKFIFAVIGRICKAKNVKTIVDAFINFKYNSKCYLLIIGKITDLDYWNSINKTIIKFNNIKQITVRPEEMVNLYGIIDGLIFLPSFGEGMARSLFESLSYKIPAIVDSSHQFNYLEYCNDKITLLINDLTKLSQEINKFYLDFKKYKQNLLNNNELELKYGVESYYKVFDSWFINELDNNCKIVKPYQNKIFTQNTNIILDIYKKEIYKYYYQSFSNNVFIFNFISHNETLITNKIDKLVSTDEYDIIYLTNSSDFILSKEYNNVYILNYYCDKLIFYKYLEKYFSKIFSRNLKLDIDMTKSNLVSIDNDYLRFTNLILNLIKSYICNNNL